MQSTNSNTKKYRLLLHIGLAKTATTSLQNNVLYPLGKEGEINFLGATRDHNGKATYYPFATICEQVVKKLSDAELAQLSLKAEELLERDKLNVLSEEVLSIIAYDINIVFHNLVTIFKNCEIQLLVSLRSPVKMFFSYYVELYYLVHYAEKHRNTFEKFSQHLLDNLHSSEYLAFRYVDFLQLIDDYFAHKTVLLFEDLKEDKQTYFQTLSNLLQIDQQKITDKFLTTKQNTKKSTPTGKQSKALKTNSYIYIYTEWLRKKLQPIKALLIYPFKLLILLTDFNIKNSPKTHNYPNAQLSAQLLNALAIKDIEAFAKMHKLDKQKLIQYNYTKTP